MISPRKVLSGSPAWLALSVIACGDDSAPLTVDTTPPTVALALGSTHLTAPGDLALSATASDGNGVTKVEFYERLVGVDETPIKIGEDPAAPYEFQRPVLSAADNGSHEFTAKAYDGAGNVGTSDPAIAVVSLEASIPGFILSASHARITTPGRITFSSESPDALDRVEILERGVTVGVSAESDPPYEVAIEVTSADNGTHTYIAKGYHSTHQGFSNSLTVTVDIRWDVIREVEGLESDNIMPLTTDPSGAVFLAATNRTGTTGAINRDVFLAKYDADGNRVWKQDVNTPEGEQVYGVGVDPSGRPFVTGLVSRPRPHGADVDCLFTIYSDAGRVEWSAPSKPGACVAAGDPSGNFYLARSEFATDIFLTKYDRNGTELWSRQFGSRPSFGNDDVLTSIVVDPQGGIYVSGYTSGSVDGEPNQGGRDVFVVKFDQAGNNLWARQFGTADHDFGSGLAADPDGGVYMGGGKDHPEFRFGSQGDALVARYSSEGSLLWVRHLDGGFFDDAWSVAADRSGVYLVGRTTGTGTSGAFSEARQGPSDAFLAKLSRDGGLLSVRLLGGPLHDGSSGVALGRAGDLYVSLRTGGGLPGVPHSSAVLARLREAP